MPVRDAEDTLVECLDSIAAQVCRRFEVVAVNDGSTDASASILRARARDDGRIRVIDSHGTAHGPGHGPGHGLVRALNLGIARCRAPIIARMDADDRMYPERLGAQLAAFERWPQAAVIGSRVRLFPPERITDGMRRYMHWQNHCNSPGDIADDIYLEAPFTHPSVAVRTESLSALGGYRDGAFPEDYDLWLRFNHAGLEMRKLRATLLDWRLSPTSLSRRDGRYSRDAFDRLRAAYLACDPRLAGDRALVVWGAGRRTRRRFGHLKALGHPARAWIDVDARKLRQPAEGLPVYPPVWLRAAKPRPLVLVYVANHGVRERIAAYLKAIGYVRGEDWLQVG